MSAPESPVLADPADPAAPVGTVDGLWAVVPAGGAGTRLWPLSRAAHPKFLLDLTGSGRTLLQQTVDRLRPLVGERVVVVTGALHRDAVLAQLPDLDPDLVLAEPSGKDSMAAIGWAAAVVERRDPGALVASFAADHVITEQGRFEDAVRSAAAAARSGSIATIGIEPTFAATGFGYIECGERLPVEAPLPVLGVERFVEKPDAPTAERYLAEGRWRWNAGMFVAGAAALLDALAENHPALAASLRDLAAAPHELESTWPTLEKIAIDHAVAEPLSLLGRLAVVPADLGWSDVGDVDAVAALVTPGGERVGSLGAVPVVVDASGAVLSTTGRTVVLVDVEDLVVVDTPDAVLVTSRRSAQRVKEAVDRLRSTGGGDLL